MYDSFDHPAVPYPQHVFDHTFNGYVSSNFAGVVYQSGGVGTESNLAVIQTGNLTYTGLGGWPGNVAAMNQSHPQPWFTTANLRYDFVGGGLPETGSVFVSFLFQMQELGGLTTNGPVDNTDTWFQLSLNRWEAGIRRNSADPDTFDVTFGTLETSDNYAGGAIGMTTGTTYLIVAEADFDNNRARLWVNPPVSGTNSPPADIDASGPGAGRPVDRITFFTNIGTTSAVEETSYRIDDVYLATSWDGATPDPTFMATIPAVSTLGLLALAGAIGATAWRRFCGSGSTG